MILRPFGASDIGLVRERNEDSFLLDEARAFFAVADGIGGMAGGEVASRTAIESLRRQLDLTPADAPLGLEALVFQANEAVRIAGRSFGSQGIGTTLTLAHVTAGGAHIAHVGDSFALLVRDGACRALTREHNIENDRENLLSLAPYPPGYRYALTRSIGQPDPLKVDLYEVELLAGDLFVLASDGLTDLVEFDRIAAIGATPIEPADIVRALIDEARANGGHDNITAIVVRVDEV